MKERGKEKSESLSRGLDDVTPKDIIFCRQKRFRHSL